MTALDAGLVVRRGTATDLVARVKQAEERGIGTVWTTVGGPTLDGQSWQSRALFVLNPPD